MIHWSGGTKVVVDGVVWERTDRNDEEQNTIRTRRELDMYSWNGREARPMRRKRGRLDVARGREKGGPGGGRQQHDGWV